MIALFIGPDDADTCDGCDDAVNGNPYTEDTVPEPGDFQCMGNCRHMVQLGEDAPDDIAPYSWNANISFVTPASKYYTDETPDEDRVTAFYDLTTPGYTPVDNAGYTPVVGEDDDSISTILNDPTNSSLYAIPDDTLAEIALLSKPGEYAQFLLDNDMVPDDLDFFDNDMDSDVHFAYAAMLVSTMDTDLIRQLLVDGEFDILQLASVQGEAALTLLKQVGQDGFDDNNAESAVMLAQLLNMKAILDDDGRWYVK